MFSRHRTPNELPEPTIANGICPPSPTVAASQRAPTESICSQAECWSAQRAMGISRRGSIRGRATLGRSTSAPHGGASQASARTPSHYPSPPTDEHVLWASSRGSVGHAASSRNCCPSWIVARRRGAPISTPSATGWALRSTARWVNRAPECRRATVAPHIKEREAELARVGGSTPHPTPSPTEHRAAACCARTASR